MSAAATLRSTSYFRGPTLDLSTLMAADVGQIVLRHLASSQDRIGVCRSVSKECRQLVDSQVHSLRANLESLSTHSDAPSLPLSFPRLERLSFERAALSESSHLLLQLAEKHPQLLAHLQVLDLRSCEGLQADTLSALLQAADQLRSLMLPRLHPFVTSSKQDFMHVIGTHGRNLQHLLGAGDYVDTSTLHHLAQLTALQSLDISTERHALHIPPRCLDNLASLSQLHILHLGNNLACYDTFELAAALPSLHSLEFQYVCETDLHVQDLAPLQRSKTLKHLTLSSVPCCDRLLEVLRGTPVTDLHLNRGPFLASQKGAAFMAGRLQRLQLFINDMGSKNLAAALPLLGSALTSLDLTIHKSTADFSKVLQAAFALPALQHLSLTSHYKELTEGEMSDLALAPHVTSLSLRNHFTDATLCSVLRRLPALQHLSLTSCSQVGSVGLGCVLSHCRALQGVRLELMRGATAAAVAALASGQSVRRVVLEGCRSVSSGECQELMRLINRPDLDILWHK